MKRWRWVEYDVVLAIHDRQLAEHGGLDGVRDENSIRSALERPKNRAKYEEPDTATIAATYAYGLVRSRGFSDGNKRTGWVVARLFLIDNRHTIKFDPQEAVRLMEGVAAGTISEAEVANWFRKRLQRLSSRR